MQEGLPYYNISWLYAFFVRIFSSATRGLSRQKKQFQIPLSSHHQSESSLIHCVSCVIKVDSGLHNDISQEGGWNERGEKSAEHTSSVYRFIDFHSVFLYLPLIPIPTRYSWSFSAPITVIPPPSQQIPLFYYRATERATFYGIDIGTGHKRSGSSGSTCKKNYTRLFYQIKIQPRSPSRARQTTTGPLTFRAYLLSQPIPLMVFGVYNGNGILSVSPVSRVTNLPFLLWNQECVFIIHQNAKT